MHNSPRSKPLEKNRKQQALKQTLDELAHYRGPGLIHDQAIIFELESWTKPIQTKVTFPGITIRRFEKDACAFSDDAPNLKDALLITYEKCGRKFASVLVFDEFGQMHTLAVASVEAA